MNCFGHSECVQVKCRPTVYNSLEHDPALGKTNEFSWNAFMNLTNVVITLSMCVLK